MEKLKRTIFFWTLVLLFILITPIIVLRARGYRFDTNRGVFVHSGTITIKSNPQSVDINLNNELIKSGSLNRINNSYNITGLIPKDYSMTVAADGFQIWSKKTEVHSDLSSEFWNILLVKNNYEKISYSAVGINKYFISPKDTKLVFTENIADGITAKILNIKGNEIESIFNISGWNFVASSRKENIEWSPEEDYLSLPVEKIVSQGTNKKTDISSAAEIIEYAYFILDPANETAFNLNDFLGKSNIKYVRWDPQDKNYLFFLSENSLYRANITNNSDIVLIADEVTSYELSQTSVYYSQSPNNLIYKSSLDGKSGPTQITYSFPNSSSVYIEKLIVYDESRIALINTDKELFIYNEGDHDKYFKKLEGHIEGLQFSDDGKKMLFWSRNEIFVYFLRDWNVQPIRSENEIQNVTRYSEEINNTQWFKDYEHIIFSSGKYVKIIELDSRDHRNCMDILSTNIDDPYIVYNNSLEVLFFSDRLNESTNILNSIVFPEKTNILGL